MPRGRCRTHRSQVLERVQHVQLVQIGETVGATLCESGFAEQSPVLGGASLAPTDAISLHFVFRRKRFDVRDPTQQPADRAQSALDFSIVHVLQDVSADNEIDVAANSHSSELSETATANVAFRAEPPEHIVAGVDARVAYPWTQPSENRKPGCFATADVENGADRATEKEFCHAHSHANFPLEARACGNAIGWVTVPPLEVGLVV